MGTRLLASTLAGLDQAGRPVERFGDRLLRRSRRRDAHRDEHRGSRLPLGGGTPVGGGDPAGGGRDPGRPRPHRLVLTSRGGALSRLLIPLQAGSGWPARLRSSMVELDIAHRRSARNGALHRDRGAEPGGEPHLAVAGDQRRVHKAIGCRAAAVCDRGTRTALRLALGSDLAEGLVLASARVMPERLLQSGFSFRHEQLDEALAPSSEVRYDTGMSHPRIQCAHGCCGVGGRRCASSS